MPDLETNWLLYGNRYPSGVATVGELAEAVMALNHKQLAAEYKGWSAPDVWKTLCAVIVDQLGVRPQQITREAEFVKDLGVC